MTLRMGDAGAAGTGRASPKGLARLIGESDSIAGRGRGLAEAAHGVANICECITADGGVEPVPHGPLGLKSNQQEVHGLAGAAERVEDEPDIVEEEASIGRGQPSGRNAPTVAEEAREGAEISAESTEPLEREVLVSTANAPPEDMV